jgi:hypothetical protein
MVFSALDFDGQKSGLTFSNFGVLKGRGRYHGRANERKRVSTFLSTAQIAALKEQLSGSGCLVHEPGSKGNAEANRLWNGAVERKPALVTACANPNDVRTALLAARPVCTATVLPPLQHPQPRGHGCNSDRAQYSNNSATPTLLFEDEHEDDFDAPGEGGPIRCSHSANDYGRRNKEEGVVRVMSCSSS